MKNIITAIVIGIALAGISYAQAPARGQGVKTTLDALRRPISRLSMELRPQPRFG